MLSYVSHEHLIEKLIKLLLKTFETLVPIICWKGLTQHYVAIGIWTNKSLWCYFYFMHIVWMNDH